jgi:hypothetical protein
MIGPYIVKEWGGKPVSPDRKIQLGERGKCCAPDVETSDALGESLTASQTVR